MGPSLLDTDHVIGHELVHAFQLDVTSAGAPGLAGAAPTALMLPLWMIEGMSEYLTLGHDDPNTAMWMRDAVRRDEQEELPTIKKLADSYTYFPYRWGQSLWSYITGKWGDESVGRIIKSAGRVGGFEGSIRRVTGMSMNALSKEWHEAMKEAYQPWLEKTDTTDPDSQVLFESNKYNRYNVSPSLSPNGDKIVLLSTKDLFSIDLYLGDARTGKIEKKTDQHGCRSRIRKPPVHKILRQLGRLGQEIRVWGHHQGQTGLDHLRHGAQETHQADRI